MLRNFDIPFYDSGFIFLFINFYDLASSLFVGVFVCYIILKLNYTKKRYYVSQ